MTSYWANTTLLLFSVRCSPNSKCENWYIYLGPENGVTLKALVCITIDYLVLNNMEFLLLLNSGGKIKMKNKILLFFINLNCNN